MAGTFHAMHLRLRLWVLLSSLWCLCAPALAHEVTPSIADFSVSEGQLTMEFRLNVEAFLAGIDLDGMSDTDESELSTNYDSYRAMGSAELEPLVRDFAIGWIETLAVDVGGPVDLSFEGVRIPVIGDTDLPRASHLLFAGGVPAAAREFRMTWPGGAGDLVLRQQGVKDPYTGYLKGGETSPAIALAGGAALGPMATFQAYVPIGFEHILPYGIDHILFVLGLFFLSPRLRPLVWQISAFTLAHTLTLALGTLGVVQVRPEIVEPLIALSIVFVALENIFVRRLYPWRVVVVFGFGLLHGLGFATVLGEYGLPAAQFIPALVGFNIGVEIGQLTVIAIAFLTVGLWFRDRSWYRGRIAIPASLVIAGIGAYWFVERVYLT
ncbi:HupE/UreJ family protein [Ruegeria sp. 2012CJ41-6]|uniref:HupE/UreJ family protein n=1 Tax=Ruegeria spongiae TaxID=2942209 RepID=A0ABT0PXZ4_9RHOB|nr:HupE/UreJ family protein [Ruegeria spongiae]MCL6282032.1 HupE/UreJ family protein [Ruegeria spongiae]